MDRAAQTSAPTIAGYETVPSWHSPNDEALRSVSDPPPTPVNGTVDKPTRKSPPRRLKNAESRPREYLTDAEVVQLMQTARHRGRYGVRYTQLSAERFKGFWDD